MKLTKREKEDVLDACLAQAKYLDSCHIAADDKEEIQALEESAASLLSAYDKLNAAWTKEVVVTTKTKKRVVR